MTTAPIRAQITRQSVTEMSVQDLFLLAMRWVHALAALLWIGGALFYALVLRPAQQRSQEPQTAYLSQAIAAEFRSWVTLCIGVLVVSGGVLTLSRLTSASATLPYMLVLGVKISLALIVFLLVRSQRRRRAQLTRPSIPEASGAAPVLQVQRSRARTLLSQANLILALGIIVFLLADVLRDLFEQSLRGG